jgi:hypothetical protein
MAWLLKGTFLVVVVATLVVFSKTYSKVDL